MDLRRHIRPFCPVLPLAASLVLLAGCSDFESGLETLWGAPVSPQGAATVVAGSATPEALDTTTPAERAAAVTEVSAGGSLGRTVASLGSPAEAGFWLKTPLVRAETSGVVTVPATGNSAGVTLIPIDGPATAGSRLSLAAMRVLGVPLTDLVELDVRRGG